MVLSVQHEKLDMADWAQTGFFRCKIMEGLTMAASLM